MIYTIPMDMHPSSGETFSSAQTPQNANSTAREMMSRLSLLREPGISSFSKTPKIAPRAITPRFAAMGAATSPNVIALPPPVTASAMQMATE